ncbi:MAG: hypothetical protein ABR575_09955 [Actinomycetota bacterium]
MLFGLGPVEIVLILVPIALVVAGLGHVEIVLIFVPVALFVALGVGIARMARRDEADEWAGAHGLALSETTRPLVVGYLTRSRRFRLTGALVGLVVPFGTEIPGLEMIAGYLIGALIAELTQDRLRAEGGMAASLSPRVLSDYVPAYVTVILRAAAVGGVALGSLLLWGPARASDLGPPRVTALAAAVGAVALPPVIELLLKRVVARPQPAVSSELVRADDAIRSASLHAAAGAGIAVSLLLLGTVAFAAGVASDVQLARWTLPFVGLAASLTGVAFWLHLGPDTPWRVRRAAAAHEVGA